MKNINVQQILENISKWIFSFSERSLQLSAIAVLHSVFLPITLAYLHGATDRLPQLDTFILVISGLAIFALRAVIKKDAVALTIHLAGFIVQIIILGMILFK